MKYASELKKPVVRKIPGLLWTDEQRLELIKEQIREQLKKMPLLAKAHGVPEGDWFALAFELAKAHVPGFKLVRSAGRPAEWSDVDKAELKLDVDNLMAASSGLPVTEALRKIPKLEAWAEKTKLMRVEALSKHYYGADERWVRIVRDARAWNLIQRDN